MSNFSQQWLVNFRRNGIIHPEQLMEIVLASLNSQRYDFEMNDRSTAKLLMQRAPVQKRSTALPPCVLLLWAAGYVIVVAGCHVGGEKRREGEGHLADHPEPARCHLLSSASPSVPPISVSSPAQIDGSIGSRIWVACRMVACRVLGSSIPLVQGCSGPLWQDASPPNAFLYAAPAAQEQEDSNVLFVGNKGCGKTTLINKFIRKEESGQALVIIPFAVWWPSSAI